MSYLAETIKNLFTQKKQTTEKVLYAQKNLDTSEMELEVVEHELYKAVDAAKALGELDVVSQELYDADPDVDPRPFGLPLAKNRHMDVEEAEDDVADDVEMEVADDDEPQE